MVYAYIGIYCKQISEVKTNHKSVNVERRKVVLTRYSRIIDIDNK